MAPETRSIGRFTDARMIGRGGFGAVYSADDPAHGRQVAIKVLTGALGETERRRFDRERQTMGRLSSHPNIIPVFESGYTDDGEGYIVMELAPGGSLAARIEQSGPLQWREAVRVAASVADAIQAAHDQGVLHRDIKPGNILVDTYGNPRLTDFGIAAVASNATTTTSTSATLAHAAPELLDGNTSTTAVDIYAIGSTFHHLVRGMPPFLNEGDAGVTPLIGRTLTQPPPDLRPLGVPNEVAAVIEKAMAKEPGGRQRTSAQLAAELREAMAVVDGEITGPAATPGATMVAPTPSADQTMVSMPPVAPPGALRPDPTAVAPTSPLGAATPGPMATAGAGPSPGGAGPQIAASTGVEGGSDRSHPLLIVLALLFLSVAGVGIGVALAGGLGGGSDTAPETTPSTTTSTSTTTTVASSTPAVGETTSPSSSSSSPSSASSATTASSAPLSLSDPCPVRIVDARTDRFDIQVCDDGSGGTSYRGANRGDQASIELPACFVGFGIFQATNEGFTYEVDTEVSELRVFDPDGNLMIAEAFVGQAFVDLGQTFASC